MKLVLKACIAAVMASFVCASATAQDRSLTPTYGIIYLEEGFMPDPHVTSLHSGGIIGAPTSTTLAGNDCRGYIAAAPDVRVEWANSSYFPLIFSVYSTVDTTLVVHSPGGRWHCDDNSGYNLNPSLRIDDPQSGQYDIWVGNRQRVRLTARLAISEGGY